MKESLSQKALLAIAILVPLTFAMFAVFFAILDFDMGFVDGDLEPKLAFFVECLGVLGAFTALAGLYLARRSPQAGRRLVILGAAAMAASSLSLQYWLGGLSVVMTVLTLLVLAIGVSRAGRLARER